MQTLHPTVFTIKGLFSAMWHYSNIEWEALEIHYGLEKFYHYCFAKDICLITNHKSLVAVIRKYVATLSQHLQHSMLHINQYSVHILYKPGEDLYIVDLLSWNNHTESRHQEITSMNLNMHDISTSVNVLICTSIEDIQATAPTGQRPTKAKILHNTVLVTQWRWSRRRHAEILANQAWGSNDQWNCHEGQGNIWYLLYCRGQILEQPHSNCMGIEKMTLLTQESVYWVNMNADINNTITQCATCLEYQQTQPHEKVIPHEVS